MSSNIPQSVIVLLTVLVLGSGIVTAMHFWPKDSDNQTGYKEDEPIPPIILTPRAKELEKEINEFGTKPWDKIAFDAFQTNLQNLKNRPLNEREYHYLNRQLQQQYISTLKTAVDTYLCSEQSPNPLRDVHEELKRYQKSKGPYQEMTRGKYEATNAYYLLSGKRAQAMRYLKSVSYDRQTMIEHLDALDRLKRSPYLSNCTPIQGKVNASWKDLIAHMRQMEIKRQKMDITLYYQEELYNASRTKGFRSKLTELENLPHLSSDQQLGKFTREMRAKLKKHQDFDSEIIMIKYEPNTTCEDKCGEFKGYLPRCDSLRTLSVNQ